MDMDIVSVPIDISSKIYYLGKYYSSILFDYLCIRYSENYVNCYNNIIHTLRVNDFFMIMVI